jgi:hypothetical protein
MKKEYKRGYAAALLAGTKPADHNRTMQLFIETLGLEVGPQGYYHIARKTHEEKDADCEGTVQTGSGASIHASGTDSPSTGARGNELPSSGVVSSGGQAGTATPQDGFDDDWQYGWY